MSFYVHEILTAFTENPDFEIQGMELVGYGSWRGSYDKPCIFMRENTNNVVTAKEVVEAIENLISGNIFYGYKGGEYVFGEHQNLNFEPSSSSWTDGYWDTLVMVRCPKLFEFLHGKRNEGNNE